MRLTTLLDSLSQGTGPTPSAPATDGPTPSAPTAAATSRDPDFDLLVASLIPCRQNDAELWFAEREAEVEQAKALCAQCPVRAGCLAGAIERAEPWGVWGGEVFIGGEVVPRKRGRGRPRKVVEPAA